MTKENFISFLNERISMASSIQTESAYITVMAAFIQIEEEKTAEKLALEIIDIASYDDKDNDEKLEEILTISRDNIKL